MPASVTKAGLLHTEHRTDLLPKLTDESAVVEQVAFVDDRFFVKFFKIGKFLNSKYPHGVVLSDQFVDMVLTVSLLHK